MILSPAPPSSPLRKALSLAIILVTAPSLILLSACGGSTYHAPPTVESDIMWEGIYIAPVEGETVATAAIRSMEYLSETGSISAGGVSISLEGIEEATHGIAGAWPATDYRFLLVSILIENGPRSGAGEGEPAGSLGEASAGLPTGEIAGASSEGSAGETDAGRAVANLFPTEQNLPIGGVELDLGTALTLYDTAGIGHLPSILNEHLEPSPLGPLVLAPGETAWRTVVFTVPAARSPLALEFSLGGEFGRIDLVPPETEPTWIPVERIGRNSVMEVRVERMAFSGDEFPGDGLSATGGSTMTNDLSSGAVAGTGANLRLILNIRNLAGSRVILDGTEDLSLHDIHGRNIHPVASPEDRGGGETVPLDEYEMELDFTVPGTERNWDLKIETPVGPLSIPVIDGYHRPYVSDLSSPRALGDIQTHLYSYQVLPGEVRIGIGIRNLRREGTLEFGEELFPALIPVSTGASIRAEALNYEPRVYSGEEIYLDLVYRNIGEEPPYRLLFRKGDEEAVFNLL